MDTQFNPVKMLLNQDSGPSAVSAPAFSLTKVLAAGATVLTPLTALLVKELTNKPYTGGQIVVLTAALLGFLAVTAAADVIARAMATANQSGAGAFVPIDPPLDATLIKRGEDQKVQLVAVRRVGDTGEYLVFEVGSALKWVGRAELKF